jgi:hypothetical protein
MFGRSHAACSRAVLREWGAKNAPRAAATIADGSACATSRRQLVRSITKGRTPHARPDMQWPAPVGDVHFNEEF